jgi:hypothetical protein
MPILNTQVWKIIISPNDRSLTYGEEIIVNSKRIRVMLHEVESDEPKSDKSYKAKYYLAQGSQTSAERNLIVMFPGRNFNFFQLKSIKYFERLYRTNKLDEYDIALMLYPKKTNSINDLAVACEQALTQLTRQGYRPKNTCVIGWCLGGYFATETLRVYAEKRVFNKFANDSSSSTSSKSTSTSTTSSSSSSSSLSASSSSPLLNSLPSNSSLDSMNSNINQEDDMYNSYLSVKSFKGINEFLYYILPTHLRFVLKFYPIKRQIRYWHNDASKSLDTCQLYLKNIHVIYAEQDNIIRGEAPIHKYINENGTIKIERDSQQPTHNPNWKWIAELANNYILNSKEAESCLLK